MMSAQADGKFRLGFVVPRSNTVCESELNRLRPSNVSFHAARLRYAAGSRSDDMSAFMAEKMEEPLEDLRLCGVDLTLLACSTAVMSMNEQAMERTRARASGELIDVLQTSVLALREIGLPRTALLTPFVEANTDAIKSRLEDSGVEVVSTKSLGLNTSPDRFRSVSRMTPEMLLDEVLTMDLRRADALFLGCCDLPTIDAIPMLEARLGMPVISMIQSLFWAAMDRIGERQSLPHRPGRLLAAA